MYLQPGDQCPGSSGSQESIGTAGGTCIPPCPAKEAPTRPGVVLMV